MNMQPTHSCAPSCPCYSRIKAVRQELYDALVKINPDKDWSFVLKQIGARGLRGRG